ncbi:MAG: zinc ABC transporter substrate-binding protein [Armatimonadetes bacterium]|nr:zinc ABC transporter substrate-binding protein [Armatimonadota bacterium]
MRRHLMAILILLWVAGPALAKLEVVTTTTDLADAAREVGGARVKVQAIAPGYQDPHQVETKPSYLTLLKAADVFVMTGLDLEVAWAPDLLRNCRNARIQPGGAGFMDSSQGIKVLQKPQGQVDRSGGDVHPQGNPHYTLSPTNQKVVARNITALLKRVDPAGSKVYDDGYRAYWKKLDEADKRWRKMLEPIKGTPVVTYHNTWPYFAEHFGLKVVGNVEPQPGISPSAAHLNQLADSMKRQGVKVIIMEPWFPDHIPQSLARKTGATVLKLPVIPGGVDGTGTYLHMMDYIVKQLLAAAR